MKTAQANTAQQVANQEALRRLLSVALVGGGAGMSIRALMGLRNLLAGTKPSVESTSSVPTSLPVPIPVEEEEKRKVAAAKCPGCGKPFPPGEPYPDVENCEACERYGLPKKAEPLSTAAHILKESGIFDARPGGRTAWWQIPASIGAGGLGIYGGWKLLDAILKAQKERREKGELADVKREYEDAMRQQYLLALEGKSAEFAGLDEIFDRFIAPMEKQAGIGDLVGDVGHGLGGLYATALGLATIGGGLAGYHWARARSKKKLTDKALRLRQLMRQNPQPIYAYPVRFPVHHPTPELEEEEEARG